MDWDDLRIFLAIAEAGSLTAAADRLGVNQSTVSRRLVALETDLGARLFDRRGSRIEPTATGARILGRAARVSTDIEQIKMEAADRDTALTGSLRITCTDSFFLFYLSRYVGRFAQLHENIEVEVATGYRHRSLAQREADVTIRVAENPTETLIGRRLFRFALAVYGAPALVHALPDNPPPESLDWVGWNHKPYNRLMITDAFPGAKIRHMGETQVDICAMVRAGMGVTHAGCFIGDPDPDLVRVYDAVNTDAPMDLWVLTHPDLVKVARVRAFIDFITDALLADRDLFEGRRAGRGRVSRHSVRR